MLLFFYHICMKELSSKISANASKLGYHDAFINYGCDALVDIMVVISVLDGFLHTARFNIGQRIPPAARTHYRGPVQLLKFNSIFSIQFYSYSGKSQQKLPQGASIRGVTLNRHQSMPAECVSIPDTHYLSLLHQAVNILFHALKLGILILESLWSDSLLDVFGSQGDYVCIHWPLLVTLVMFSMNSHHHNDIYLWQGIQKSQ